jgi:hypothetical protein
MFSNDGRSFATAGQDKGSPNWRLRLYDATSGSLVRIVAAIVNGIRNIDFSPDDSRILVSCGDGVRIYHAPSISPGQSDVSDSLWAIYATSGVAVTVSAANAAARQGEIVEVPITIDNPSDAVGSGATRIDMTLRYNVTLLDPIESTPRGTFDRRERTIALSFPLTSDVDTILGVLRFRAALGNDSTTMLDLSGATADVGSLSVAEQDGIFRLRDLCYEGGPRLLNPNGAVTLKAVVTDASPAAVDAEIETIEGGGTTLTLVDLGGNVVRTLLDDDPPPGRWSMRVALDDVPSGRYFLVLRTRTVVKTAAVEIAQ